MSSIFIVNSAQADLYISGNVGRASVQDFDTTDTFTLLGLTVVASGETGVASSDVSFAGAVGYAFNNGFRLEAEASYLSSELDRLTVDQATVLGITIGINQAVALQGDYNATGYMANGWFDIDMGSKIVPFVGGGIGLATVNLDLDNIAGFTSTYDESDTVFAYQAGVGLGYKIAEKTLLNLSYRYFATSDLEFDDGVDRVTAEFLSHNVFVGIVQKF